MQSFPSIVLDRLQQGVSDCRIALSGNQQLLQKLELTRRLEGHAGCVNTVTFSPCGELLVSGSDDQLIKFWDWTTGSERLSYTSGHFDNVFQARIMPESSNSTVVSCAADGQVRAAQIQPCGGPVATTRLARHRGRAHKLALEPRSAHCFLSCGEDGEVRHFDLREQPPASRRLLVCRAVMGRLLELNSVHCSPACPSQFVVGGSDEYCRVYDLRRPAVSTSSAAGAAIAEPLQRVTPTHLRGGGASGLRGGVHITCAVFNRNGEILASYNDENIYLLALAGERYRVRRVPDKGRLLQVGGKRQRSRDSSQRDMPGSRRAARSTGIPADATRSASDLHDTRSDLPMRLVPAGVHQPSVAQRAQQPRIRTDQEERHAADERPSCAPPVSSTGSGRHVVLDVVEPPTTDSTAHGAADGDFPHPAHGGDLHSERRSLPGPMNDGGHVDAIAGSSEYEAEWRIESSPDGNAGTDEGDDSSYDDSSDASGDGDDSYGVGEILSDSDSMPQHDHGSSGGGRMSDVDSLPPFSDTNLSGEGSRGVARPHEEPVLQCYRGHRNAQTVKGVSFMGMNDEWVVSGSDCGHIFIWGADDGELRCMLKGDTSVVNCLEPHPFQLLTLASSGIDDDVKLWAPTGERRVPGAEARCQVQRNARQQNIAVPPHPLLLQHLLPPGVTEQLMARMAIRRGATAQLQSSGSDGSGGDDEGYEDGEASPECSVQ